MHLSSALPALLSLLAVPLGAQSFQISDPLPDHAVSEVIGFTPSPDGTRVAFYTLERGPVGIEFARLWVTDADGMPGPLELHLRLALAQDYELSFSPDASWLVFLANDQLQSVPGDGSGPVRALSDSTFGPAESFVIDPAGARVAFIAGNGSAARRELFVAPIDGSTPAVVVGPIFQPSGAVLDFALSPDGAWAVYRTAPATGGNVGLFGVPLDGSAAPVRLDLPRPGAEVQPDYVVSHDSLGVVYRHDQDAAGVFELFVTRIDGGSPLPLQRNAPLVAGGDVHGFALAPNDLRLVYRADQDVDGVHELYSTPTFGGPAVELSGPVDVADFRLAASGTLVVYRNEDLLTGRGELRSVPSDGSAAPIALSDVGATGDDVRELVVTAAGTVVFRTEGPGVLHAVPAAGGAAALRLSPDTMGTEIRPGIVLVPGEASVVYVGRTGGAPYAILSVPLDASAAPATLNGELAAELQDPRIAAASGGRVLYLARDDRPEARELYSAPADGGAPALVLNRPLRHEAPAGDVVSFVERPDGRGVFYRADHDANGVYDVFLVDVDGSGARRVHEWLAPGADAGADLPLVGPERIVYSVRFSDGGGEVRSAGLDGGDPIVLVDVDGRIGTHRLSSDGAWLTYVAAGRLERVATDGSGPPVLLSEPSGVEWAWFSPDDQWAVYRRWESPGVTSLSSVRLDGSAPPRRLLAAGGVVELTSTHAVYEIDHDLDGESDVYAVRLDGSAPPVLLSAGGLREEVTPTHPFRISPDGTRVLYAADPDGDLLATLFVVPIDGGAALALGPVNRGTSVVAFEPGRISPDSRWVVFQRNSAELLVAPLDGSAPARALSSALPQRALYDITADSTRAVFVAGRRLFSAYLDGRAPPLQLTPLVSFGDVGYANEREAFVLTPDGNGVVFLADLRQDEVYELFVVPIDGSRAPRAVSGEMVSDGDAAGWVGPDFRCSSSGDRVFYLADERVDGASELFGSFLQRTARRTAPPERTR